MRIFKKGENILKTDDPILARAIKGSGYEEIIEKTEAEPEKAQRKRSKLDEE